MTVTPPPGLAGAELDEWQAIHGKHRAELAFRGGAIPPRAVSLAELQEHAAGMSAAGVVFGPDTSEYQGKPAWGTVRTSGCRLGFYKVSEGRTYEDPSHQWSKTRVPGAGLAAAGYHFLYFSQEYVDNPKLWAAQADFFCSLVDPNIGHVLDVEAAATAGHHLGVKEWVAEYRRLFPGHPLGLYANLALWTNRSRMPYNPAGLFDYVWHAGVGNGYYAAATGSIPQQWAGTSKLTNSFVGRGFPECRLWQITDHAQVPGVGGPFCDGNAFQGSAADLQALITGTGDADMPITDDDAVRIARAVHNQQLFNDQDGKTPITIGYALHTLYRGAGSADELSPAAVQAVATALGPVLDSHLAAQAPQIAQAVVAAQGSGPGGQLTAADVEDAVRHVVSQSRIAVDAPTA